MNKTILIIVCLIICLLFSSSIGIGIYYQQTTETPPPTPKETPKETPTTETPPAFTISNKTTGLNDSGGGNAIFLDRHDIECGEKSALNQFNLATSGTKVNYNFKCNSASDIGSPVSKGTGFNEEGGGNVIYLDRHVIKCDPGSAISRIHLTRNGANKFQYEYKCVPIPKLTACVNKSTVANEDGNGNFVYLDRQNVQCEANQVLSKVNLTRPSDKTIRYDYTCCARG